MNKIQVTTRQQLDELANGSALTFVGLIADDENLGAVAEWIKQHTKMIREDAYIFDGGLMNREFGLTGDNAYPEGNCTFVCIKLEDLETPMALAIPRFQVGGRWLDDVISNDLRREQDKRGED